MKYFIAYRHTGEDPIEVEKYMKKICEVLEEKGHEYYCTLFEDRGEFDNLSKKEIMDHAFGEIDKSDKMIVLLNYEKKSEGMLMEVGYCLSKNKEMVLLINKKISKTYLRDMIDNKIEYSDIDDLINKIKESKL